MPFPKWSEAPMSDDKTAPHDAARVNVHEDHEVRYWTQRFGCSAAKLQEAVQKVGTSSERVEQYLNG